MSEIKKQLELNGYVFIPSHFPDEETLTSMSNLGEVLHITNINQKQTLIPIKPSNSNLNTYSGNYGLSAFPLHTDLAHWVVPPRYFALRCMIGSEHVPTRLVNTKGIISEIGRTALKRALVKPRRPVDGKCSVLRLLECVENQKEFFRWDSLFISPINEYCKSVIKDVGQYLNTADEMCVHLVKQGDTVVIDNWKMLHGRAPINQDALNRKIERVYLKEVF